MRDDALPPPPLVSVEVDLRDFGFMPLDVRTLLTSSLWIKAKKDPRVAHAAVSLWCECWHQVPAASLPDDDEVLADLARCDAKEWARIRERALLHFVKCSDGRLYHRHVAAKAVESWSAKQAQRARTKAASEAREKQRQALRDEQRDVVRDEQRDESRDVHQGTGTVKGQGQGQGLIHPNPRKRGSGAVHEFPPGFDRLWSAYPRKVAKPKAAQAFARLKVDDAMLAAMLSAIERQRASPQWAKDRGEFIPHPATWLNGRRWEDGETSAQQAAADPNAWRRDERGLRGMQQQLGIDGPLERESMNDFEARILRHWRKAGEPAWRPTEAA